MATSVVRSNAAPTREPLAAWTGPAIALLGGAALVVVAFVWGDALLADGVRLQLHTPPFDGVAEWHGVRAALPAAAVGVFVIACFVPWTERAAWSALLAATAVLGALWAVALARIDGPTALTGPLRAGQYLSTVPLVGDPQVFLRNFTDRITAYNLHTQAHPPGMVMLLWALDRIGLGGVRWNAALVVGGGAAANVAALVAVRTVAGTAFARRLAPFLVLTPAAIWWSAGDAFFAAVALAAIAVTLAAVMAREPADGTAALGGVLFAVAALFSYGLVVLAAVPAAVAVSVRRIRPLVVAGVVAVAVLLAVALVTGFAWWQGLSATRDRYYAGVASRRPYEYFVVANLAVFALSIGPAAVAGLARVRRSPVAALVLGAFLAVVLADVSGMSKGEVERIWIPFVPLAMVGAVTVARRRSSVRCWLGAQTALALCVAMGIRSKW